MLILRRHSGLNSYILVSAFFRQQALTESVPWRRSPSSVMILVIIWHACWWDTKLTFHSSEVLGAMVGYPGLVDRLIGFALRRTKSRSIRFVRLSLICQANCWMLHVSRWLLVIFACNSWYVISGLQPLHSGIGFFFLLVCGLTTQYDEGFLSIRFAKLHLRKYPSFVCVRISHQAPMKQHQAY